MTNALRNLLTDNSGATLVEYALVLTLIAIVSIICIKLFGTNTSTLLNSAASSV